MNGIREFFQGRMKLSFALLWAYLWVLSALQSIAADAQMTIVFWLLLGVLSGYAAFLALRLFSDKADEMEMDGDCSHSILCGIIAALITFLLYMIYFAGQYPGGLGADTIEQYAQALGETAYNDWHPVLHTWLFLTLSVKLGRGLGCMVFLQLAYFSAAFGYLGYVLRRNRCPLIFLSVICIFVWINPFMAAYMMYPWKDIALTIFAILLMAYDIQIICSKGEWLHSKINLVLFAAVAVLCTYMRHNAILFVAPLALTALFYAVKDRKIRAAAILLMTAGFLLVKLSYVCAGVVAPGGRVLETVGLPGTVWSNVMQKKPEALPVQTREVMYSLAAEESYAEIYVPGDFNSIKWSGSYDIDRMDRMSYGEVLKYTIQCFWYAPAESFEALAKLTDLVWGVDGKEEPILTYVNENEWGYENRPFLKPRIFLKQVKAGFTAGFGRILFGSTGLELLIMSAAAMMLLARGRASFVHLLPLFCYDFGTMLLLSGADYRFFLLNLPLWLPVLFLMLRDRRMLPGRSA